MSTTPSPVAPAAPVAPKLNLQALAADITKFGGTLIAIETAVVNTVPGISVPAGWQAVLSAVVAIGTGLLAVTKHAALAKASVKTP